MAITDELREYAEIVPRLTSDLTAIADRIDAEHAEAQRRWMAELDAAREQSFLREQMERLVTLLRNDCDIDASWDGLRRFWSIGLTENGCLMRDRACKAESENAKLRELCVKALEWLRWAGGITCPPEVPDEFADELRKLGIEADE